MVLENPPELASARRRSWFFDIDGTLSDPSHRLGLIQGTPKDWRAFFAAVGEDTPIEPMVSLCSRLFPNVVFVSGRSDECRDATVAWLQAHISAFAHKAPLYMRRAGDYRPDDVVKMELMAAARTDGFEPLMIFEDRGRVVQAFRTAGFLVAQVAEGNF